jgi:hypothetical protein
MVILLFTGVRKSSIPQRTILRQVLRDENYESENPVGGIATQREEGRNVVRLIKAGTIRANKYPLSHNSVERSRQAGFDVWEDEGGAIEGEPRCPPA